MTGRGGRLAAVALAGLVAVGLLVVATWGTPPDEQAGGRPVPTQEPPADQDTTGPPAATGRVLPSQWPEFVPTRLAVGEAAAAQVEPVAVADGTLALPVDADRVGWWRDGSRAGAPFGTVVLAGHLDSDTDPAGYLAGLAAVAPGDVVELSGGGERQDYRVTDNYLLPARRPLLTLGPVRAAASTPAAADHLRRSVRRGRGSLPVQPRGGRDAAARRSVNGWGGGPRAPIGCP